MNNENKILLERAINNTVILDDKLDRLETEIRSLRAGQVYPSSTTRNFKYESRVDL